MTGTSLHISDPTCAPTFRDGALSRWCKAALYDPRDEVFVRLTIKVVVVMTLMMACLLVRFTWVLVPIYWLVWGWFAPPVILMLHCTMHRPFIRRPKLLGRVHPYVMTFFFGIPAGYAEHHMGMHHVEDNMSEDLSSTLRYRRDSFVHFLAYFGRFFFFVLGQLTLYLARKGRMRMARRAFFGELIHLTLIAGAMAIHWRFALVALAIPTVAVRFMMMVGNWGQHAFVNTARPNDGLANSITCINSGYNRRAFNDGYHIGHHLKANRHWTEMPQDFLDNREAYAQSGAIVFEGIDFFMVSVLLWTGQWRVLSKRFVHIEADRLSQDEVIARLKARVHPIRPADWVAGFEGARPAR